MMKFQLQKFKLNVAALRAARFWSKPEILGFAGLAFLAIGSLPKNFATNIQSKFQDVFSEARAEPQPARKIQIILSTAQLLQSRLSAPDITGAARGEIMQAVNNALHSRLYLHFHDYLRDPVRAHIVLTGWVGEYLTRHRHPEMVDMFGKAATAVAASNPSLVDLTRRTLRHVKRHAADAKAGASLDVAAFGVANAALQETTTPFDLRLGLPAPQLLQPVDIKYVAAPERVTLRLSPQDIVDIKVVCSAEVDKINDANAAASCVMTHLNHMAADHLSAFTEIATGGYEPLLMARNEIRKAALQDRKATMQAQAASRNDTTFVVPDDDDLMQEIPNPSIRDRLDWLAIHRPVAADFAKAVDRVLANPPVANTALRTDMFFLNVSVARRRAPINTTCKERLATNDFGTPLLWSGHVGSYDLLPNSPYTMSHDLYQGRVVTDCEKDLQERRVVPGTIYIYEAPRFLSVILPTPKKPQARKHHDRSNHHKR